MATTIGKLAVILSANTAKYGSGMRRASTTTTRFGETATKSIFTVKRALAGLTAVVAGGGLVAALRRQIASLESIGRTAAKIGTTTEELSRLQFAGEQTGVAVNTMNMALQRMVRRISEAANGTGEAKDAIKELGLSAQSLERAGPVAAIRQIADAMAAVPNQADRVRLAMRLFDSEGVALVNTLQQGSGALIDFARQSDAVGATISQSAVTAAINMNSAFGKVAKSVQALGAAIIDVAGPSVVNLANQTTKLVNTLRNLDSATVKTIGRVAVLTGSLVFGLKIAPKIIAAIRGISTAIKALIAGQITLQSLAGPKGWATIAAGLAIAAATAVSVSAAMDKVTASAMESQREAQAIADGVNEMSTEATSAIAQVNDSLNVATTAMTDLGKSTQITTDRFSELESRAKAIFDATRTPTERLAARVKEIGELAFRGLLDDETAQRALDQISEEQRKRKFGDSGGSMEQRLAAQDVSFGALGAKGAAGRATNKIEKATENEYRESRRHTQLLNDMLVELVRTGQEIPILVNF